MDAVTLAAATAAAKKQNQPRRTYTAADIFPAPAPGYTSSSAQAVGVGAGGAVYMIQGTTLRRTPDLGVHGYGVGIPTNTTASTCLQVYEWNGYVYGIFQDSTDSGYKLYRAPITTGSTALTWSAALFTLTAGTLSFGCTITGTSQALLVGEYGDPVISTVKTAHIWRSTDGTTFTAVKTYGSTVRHIHAVAADPYNDGTVWCSFGDNVPGGCYSISTDHGATWTDLPIAYQWQGVQISFTKDWVYVAPDAVSHAPLFVFDRATKTPRVGSFGDHRTLRISDPGTYTNGVTTSASTTFTTGLPDFFGPFTGSDKGRKIIGAGIPDGTTIATVNSSGNVTLSAAATVTATTVSYTIDRNERPCANCFLGAVDPATGIYYGFANNEPSTAVKSTYPRYVLFAVPYVGGPVIHLADLTVYGPTVLFDGAGNVWCGHVYRPLIQAPYLA